MTEQKHQSSIQDLIKAKLEADERAVEMMIADVEAAFKGNPEQEKLIANLAIKAYHNSNDIDELNVQGMYANAVLDALCKILIEELKIIPQELMQRAVEEAHKTALAAVEEANDIYADALNSQSDDITSEVTTL